MFTTDPHGEHDLVLLEDASKPDNRIYEVVNRYEKESTIRILGSELDSLCQWWAAEKNRAGEDEEGD